MSKADSDTMSSEVQANQADDAYSQDQPVPLCVPENYTRHYDSESVDEPSGTLKICETGLNLLRSVGEDYLIPVCITGPSRTGKSTFLSMLQKNIKFKTSHTTTKQTLGIWLGLGEEIMINDQKARMIFVDTEGTGSVSTRHDHLAHHTWDSKILSLSLLICTFFIYNNSKIPTMDDLNQLDFLSNFAANLQSSTENETEPMCPLQTKSELAHFIWLIRDVSLTPFVDGFKTEWTTYVNSILDLNEARLKIGKSRVAIKTFFQSVTAFGIPVPSMDENILENILEHSKSESINPNFLTATQKVITFIHENKMVKKHGGLMVTGNMLAKLIPSFVNAINTKSENIPMYNMWDNFVHTQLQEKEEEAFDSYRQTVENISLPKSAQELQNEIEGLLAGVENFFSSFDKSISSKSIQKVKTKIQSAFEILKKRNEDRSEIFCGTLISNLKDNHVNQLLHRLPAVDFSEFQNAVQKIKFEYQKQALGPRKFDLQFFFYKFLDDQLPIASAKIGEAIVQTQENKLSIFIYKAIEKPRYEGNEQQREYDMLLQNLWEEFHERCNGMSDNEYQRYERELDDAIQNHTNEFSSRYCEKKITGLIQDKLKKYISKSWFLPFRLNFKHYDFDDAKKELLSEYRKMSMGPKEQEILGRHREEIDNLVEEGCEQNHKTFFLVSSLSAICMSATISPIAGAAMATGATVAFVCRRLCRFAYVRFRPSGT